MPDQNELFAKLKAIITDCDNVVGAMYYEYKDLMNTPNNIVYTQANTLKKCLSNTLEFHSFPADPVLQNKMRCFMLSNLICSCANLVPQEVGSVQHFKNRAVVVENLSRFKHRFAGQGVAMEKLESFAFCEVQKIRSEDQIKQIVIDFVTEINKSWDIDHKTPISSAKTKEDVIRLSHYTNFQPLCSYRNRFVKRNK